MDRRPVQSSNVSSVGWEPSEENSEFGTLEVGFKTGHVYQYAQVPEYVYHELVGAGSVGRYLNQEVIGTYDDTRIR